MYDALAEQGANAPVVAFPNGEGDSYWHDRGSGDWGSWITGEVIPRLAEDHGIDPGAVAIGGISMGGFGALDIARLHSGRFCAVGAHSPALWQTGAETAAGAFDNAADFSRHDVIATARSNPGAFAGTPLWIDGGKEDPFQPGIRAFTEALISADISVSAHTPPGEHEGEYWDAHWDEYLDFYSKALGRC
jgi:S-formylglutathione hydrolase FrmB